MFRGLDTAFLKGAEGTRLPCCLQGIGKQRLYGYVVHAACCTLHVTPQSRRAAVYLDYIGRPPGINGIDGLFENKIH